jgi:hypothetical protein
MKKVLICTLLFLSCSVSFGADADPIYITDEGFVSLNYSNKLAESKKSKECFSVEKFPEGNWGTIEKGFQLSLRFDKQRFTNGEPIHALILLRNTTNHSLSYPACISSIAGKEGPIGLRVYSGSGETILPIQDDIEIVSTRDFLLRPKTQHKYVERLDTRYKFSTNGTYFVQAGLIVMETKEIMTVTSAKVPITID